MKRVNLDTQILDQMNRQIDFAYFMAGIIVTIAIFVMGYQVYINTKTVKKLKEENAEELKKLKEENTEELKETILPLLILGIFSSMKSGMFTLDNTEEFLIIYKNTFEDNKKVKQMLIDMEKSIICSQLTYIFEWNIDREALNAVVDNIFNLELSLQSINDEINSSKLEIKEDLPEETKNVTIKNIYDTKKLFLEYNI